MGALTAFQWAADETERRLVAANQARQAGHPPPEDVTRPLYVLADRPSALGRLAADGQGEGERDPLSLLQVPLRHGRAAGVTVVVADQYDSYDGTITVPDSVLPCTRARVVLGPVADRLAGVLGAAPSTTPAPRMPPGRGHARLGDGPVLRLQVPATPDPCDDATSDAHRQAVLALLPPRAAAPGGEGAADVEGPPTQEVRTARADRVPIETAAAEG